MNTSRIAMRAPLKRRVHNSVVFAALAFLMFGATTLKGQSASESQGSHSVVGFWHVKLVMNDGNLLFQSTVQYHPDGTEQEFAALAPYGGVCQGLWKEHRDTVEIYTHVAWLFDSGGNPIGYAVLTETNKLSKDGNSYEGHFDLKQYYTNGDPIGEVKGTTTAHRIDAQHAFSVF